MKWLLVAATTDPGRKETSVVWIRMSRREPVVTMPPLGTWVVDPVGATVVGEWIDSMTGCP